MAYIVPNSLLYLLKNVPLDPNYKHTWYFNNGDTQRDKFLTYSDPELRITDSQYIKYEAGSVKVPFTMEQCISCNYMMFGNVSFEHKWFYAFITNVEYVSNDVTRIYFKIDEIQTWFINCHARACFIERQHTVTDVAGENLVPEELETGDYVISQVNIPVQQLYHSIVIASTYNTDGTVRQGSIYNRIYSGVGYAVFATDAQGVGAASQYLADLQSSGKNDAVVSVFMAPTFIFNEPQLVYVYLNKPTTIGQYTPKNKKLLTSPYTFAYVTNHQGISAKFNWEYFSGQPTFELRGSISCDPQLVTWPINYKGVQSNLDELMTVGGFPQCAYNTDSFKAWVAQQFGGNLPGAYAQLQDDVGNFYSDMLGKAIDTIKSQPASLRGLAQVGILSTWKNHVDNPQTIGWEPGEGPVTGLLKRVVERFINPPQSSGNSGGSGLFSINCINFNYMEKHIREEFAFIIDDYFTKYGYAIHRLAVPNFNARPCWTYIKTKNCLLDGEAPSDSVQFIENCIDSGITFWNPNITMGDYWQDNSPRG